MKVMVIVKGDKAYEDGAMPSTDLLAKMNDYNEQLVNAGVMLAGEGLHPTSKARRIQFAGTERKVIDGPFAETKELIGGFWLWQVGSMDEAVEWLKKAPFEEGDVDIRPIFEAEDFGEEFTPELREREAELYARIATKNSAILPYLFFGGRCEEALEFYRQSIGATIGAVVRFSDSPAPLPDGMVPKGWENKVMHSEFTVGGNTLMASDGCSEQENFSGFRLSLTLPTVADVERVFSALAEGGRVDAPLEQTFWSAKYGQVTDEFGLGWMVMVQPETHGA